MSDYVIPANISPDMSSFLAGKLSGFVLKDAVGPKKVTIALGRLRRCTRVVGTWSTQRSFNIELMGKLHMRGAITASASAGNLDTSPLSSMASLDSPFRRVGFPVAEAALADPVLCGHRSAAFMPATCSFRIAMICFSKS
jgi:hypothetical protein